MAMKEHTEADTIDSGGALSSRPTPVALGRRARPDGSGPVTEHITYCRICEPLCGMVVSVADGRVVDITGDKQNPATEGYLCSKGAAMKDIQADPDRVLRPLRRVGGPGDFEECTWDEAMNDIASRLKRIVADSGGASIGGYLGNPAGMHTGHMYWLTGFLAALGSHHLYSAGSQDTNTRMVASHLLYGSPLPIPFPDVKRTTFMLMFGANPLVSKGSLWTVPRVRQRLDNVVAGGGRVVVVDPRRSETARAYEHIAVQADTDAWLVAGMIGEVFREGLQDDAAIAVASVGVDRLRAMCERVSLQAAQEHTGVPAVEIRALAKAFASAPRAVAYTRTGVCTGSFGTLTNFLVDALNVITGNLDRPGGAVFGDPPISFDELGARFGMASVGTHRTRVGDLPDVASLAPSVSMPAEITTPGPGQLRALIVAAGNIVLSTPGAEETERALEALDLLVCLDIYVTETSKHAHYILPGTTFLERADMPATLLQWAATPFVQATEKVIDPPGECREEHHFYDEMSRRLGLGGPFAFRSARLLARLGLFRPTPMQLVNLMIRTGRHGDWFGLRRKGLNLKKILAQPHGIVLAEHPATGVLRRKVKHKDRKVHLAHPEMEAELERLLAAPAMDEQFPLRLIGRRESRSHNSWMHNVPSRHTQAPLQMNPADAAARAIDDGDIVRVNSRDGALEVAVSVTDEIVAGTVTLSHGWGHQAGWTRANAKAGVNYNLLTAARPEAAEQLSGMSHLNGVGVQIERSSAAR
ncbi:MAG: molybdopterin-dependent oxidoreductase [Acidimicrobiales bacterium]